MDHKHKVVLFESGKVRRIIITDDITSYINDKNAIIDPDMNNLKGIAPHNWTVKNGKLVKCNIISRFFRFLLIKYWSNK
jgi:hypothetical protein